jgi:hypothetical protein
MTNGRKITGTKLRVLVHEFTGYYWPILDSVCTWGWSLCRLRENAAVCRELLEQMRFEDDSEP